jgi:hypothetical protein
MKRLIMVLIALFTAATLLAGGKECDAARKNVKNVELTGTLASVGTGDAAKTVFRVAGSDQSYTVCEKTKSSVLKLTNTGTLQVKGKLVSCGEGQELLIDEAKKI